MNKERRNARAIGYIRVSTHEQAMSGLSLESQRKKIEAQAEVSDLELIEIIEDAGQSASSLKRPGMERLLEILDNGEVDMVVIAKLDRLTRSIKDLADLLERLGKSRRFDGGKGIDLISSGESLDTSTATGRLVINIMASVSQWEREIIAERTSQAIQELKAQDKYTGGRADYGYTVDEDGSLIENPLEQEVLALVREKRDREKASWAMIARFLDSQGKKTRTGGKFSRQGIYQMAQKAGIE